MSNSPMSQRDWLVLAVSTVLGSGILTCVAVMRGSFCRHIQRHESFRAAVWPPLVVKKLGQHIMKVDTCPQRTRHGHSAAWRPTRV